MSLKQIQLRTVEPCSEDWQKMAGNQRARHCEACCKTVHNIATMRVRDVERLALRAAMGEGVCARITRQVVDDELVIAPGRSTNRNAAAGVVLSTAMFCGASAIAQEVRSPQAGTAVLTGRLQPPSGPPILLARGVVLRPQSGPDIVAAVQADGSFSVSVPPGTYDIVARNNYWQGTTVKAAELHEGYQSLGDVQPRPRGDGAYEYTTGGAMVATISHGFWLRHPLSYVRYLGRRIRTKSSQ